MSNAPTVDMSQLTDRQIVNWYARHPHPTVRALCLRLGQVLDRQATEIVEAYQEGLLAGKVKFPTESTSYNSVEPPTLSPDFEV